MSGTLFMQVVSLIIIGSISVGSIVTTAIKEWKK